MGWEGRASVNNFTFNHIGHFDVIDRSEVLEEAYELVDDGDLTEVDFQSFAFGNTARLHTAMNPEFFKGTVVEAAVSETILAG